MSHTERKHARLAPSAAHRWIACPGTVRMCEAIPDSGPSVFADEGTAAHELAERCLNNGGDAVAYSGQWIEVNGTRFEVDDEMVEGVQMYLDYVRLLFDKCDYYFIEERVDCTHIHPEIWGTGDAIGYEEAIEHLHVCDFKYGRGVAVDPEDNEQEMIYASGAIKRMAREGRRVRKVTLHIVQPRAPHKDGLIRTWSAGINYITDFEHRARAAAKATEDPAAPLKAGDHCKFCRAAAICPERRQTALDAARIEFGDDGVMDAPKFERFSPDQLGRLLSEIDQVEAWCKAVREFAHFEAGEGRLPAGWKLVARRAVRKWKDEATTIAALKTIFELSDDDLFTKKLISPAGADKLLGKEAKKLAGLYSKVSSGTTLAPENDPREAVRADPGVEFCSE